MTGSVTEPTIYTGIVPGGHISQHLDVPVEVLVTVYEDGTAEVAFRDEPGMTSVRWGVPSPLERQEP